MPCPPGSDFAYPASLLPAIAKAFGLDPRVDANSLIRHIDRKEPADVVNGLLDTIGESTYEAWTVLFAIHFAAFRPIPKPIVNSANCCFTFLEAQPRGGGGTGFERLFVKLVPRAAVLHGQADLPLLDSVHAILLEHLAGRMPEIEQHILKPRGSFLTSMRLAVGNDDSWPLCPQLDVDASPSACPFAPHSRYREPPEHGYAFALVFDALRGHSVHTTVKTYGEAGIADAMKALPAFARMLRALGLRHGMVHNDLHLQNVFLENGRLVMIDYGRMRFVHYERSRSLKAVVQREAVRNMMDLHPSVDYGMIANIYQRNVIASAVSLRGSYLAHVFDVIALCANLEAMWRWCNRSYPGHRSICLLRPSANDRRNLMEIVIPPTVEAIIGALEAHCQGPDATELSRVLGEGLAFTALLLYHAGIVENRFKARTGVMNGQPSYVIRMQDVKDAGVLYYYFQSSMAPKDVDAFLAWLAVVLESNRDRLIACGAPVCSEILQGDVASNGGSASGRASASARASGSKASASPRASPSRATPAPMNSLKGILKTWKEVASPGPSVPSRGSAAMPSRSPTPASDSLSRSRSSTRRSLGEWMDLRGFDDTRQPMQAPTQVANPALLARILQFPTPRSLNRPSPVRTDAFLPASIMVAGSKNRSSW